MGLACGHCGPRVVDPVAVGGVGCGVVLDGHCLFTKCQRMWARALHFYRAPFSGVGACGIGPYSRLDQPGTCVAMEHCCRRYDRGICPRVVWQALLERWQINHDSQIRYKMSQLWSFKRRNHAG